MAPGRSRERKLLKCLAFAFVHPYSKGSHHQTDTQIKINNNNFWVNVNKETPRQTDDTTRTRRRRGGVGFSCPDIFESNFLNYHCIIRLERTFMCILNSCIVCIKRILQVCVSSFCLVLMTLSRMCT